MKDPYAAYCLDTAVGEFGRTLDGELKDIEGKNKKQIQSKAQRLMTKWLDLPKQYRDPARSGRVTRRPTKDD